MMKKNILFKQGNISFSDSGKGRVLVLLHGFLGSSKIWEKMIHDISKSYRVIAIDLPGHGLSDCYGYVHTVEMMAQCVKKVMDSLRLKKYVIIGHSMGGYVGLAFADLFPDHLKGIGLFHSSAYNDTEEKKKDRSRSIKIVKANPKIYTTEVIKNLFATKNTKYLKEEIQFAQSIGNKVSQRAIIASLEGMKDRPNREVVLAMVNYPVLFVIGELDNVIPYNQLLEQTNLVKNKHVVYLEHDGHMGFLESPKTCIKALRKFLRLCFKNPL